MTRYELAIATADWLERSPEEYYFFNGVVPFKGEIARGSQRCLLGQMGILTEMFGADVALVSQIHLGIPDQEFYKLMSMYSSDDIFDYIHFGSRWIKSASIAAVALRKLADRNFRTPNLLLLPAE